MVKRTKARRRQLPKAPPVVMAILRGCLLGMIFTLSAILLFALLLKIGLFGEGAIPVVNQVLKLAGIAIAALASVRSMESRQWLWGGVGGGSYVLCGMLLFSAIEGTFNPSVLLLSDLALGVIGGVIIGFIRQKVKK